MNIGIPREGRPLLPAALALVLLGASLVFLTWRNLESQRELIDNHVRLSARGTLRGIQTSLTRAILRARPDSPEALRTLVEDYFKEMTSIHEVALLALYDETGRNIVFSSPGGVPPFNLPADVVERLETDGEWFVTQAYADLRLLLFFTQARPELEPDPRGPLFPLPPPFPPGMPPFPGPPPMPGSSIFPGPPSMSDVPRFQTKPPLSDLPVFPSPQSSLLPPFPPFGLFPGAFAPRPRPYILLGLNLEDYEGPYLNVRRAAILQAGYVLAMAAFTLILVVAATRRREQGQRLTRLESFHSKLLDNMPDGLVTLDGASRITAFNPAAQELLSRLTGRSADALMGADWEEVAAAASPSGPIPADSPPESPTGPMIDGPALSGATSRESWRLLEKEGLSLELRGVPLAPADTGGPGASGEPQSGPAKLILLRDRSRIRRLEHDLAEATKLAAIGRLAAGVAHEIRNPLSSLRGFAQFFAAKLKGREPEETYALTMVHEADRLNRVVADLLFLSRPRQLSPEPVDLPSFARELSQILQFDIEHKHALIATDFPVATLVADPDALKQALINLILNSLAALPETGGTITLASALSAPGRVTLTVSDDGCGIEPGDLQKVLEPFHTTKKHGSGLGLAIVHKIMRDHDGALSISSVPGQGTRVELTFPERTGSGAHNLEHTNA
ncbi:MAG: ATP-binding protein [Desulfovibrionaceae bacterium]|nr:ATP-binding protein [Desulfovibrionaceae bacterium]